MAIIVAVSIPPATAVPMAFIAPAPAPVAITNGMTPKKKASEVITIGRSLNLDASTVAAIRSAPWAIRSLAN